MAWYFAFGSNLDPAQLAEREVAFSRHRRCVLRNWKLAFNKVATLNAVPGEGRANIVPARGRVVEGVVFDVTEEGLANLDWYEGAKTGHYRRTEITVDIPAEPCVAALTYVAAFTGTGLKPSPWYLSKILAGAQHFGLSREYIAALEAWPTVGPRTRPDV